jgi:predicted transcriptional regulator
MTTVKIDKANAQNLRANEKKWTKPLMEAGWSAVPSILIEKQDALGLDPVDMNIILHLIQYWWHVDNLPHPSVGTIGKAIGRDPRTVTRRIAALESLGFLERTERRHTKNGSDTNLYSFNGLIEKLQPFAAERIQDKKFAIAKSKDRIARKKPAAKLVVNNMGMPPKTD